MTHDILSGEQTSRPRVHRCPRCSGPVVLQAETIGGEASLRCRLCGPVDAKRPTKQQSFPQTDVAGPLPSGAPWNLPAAKAHVTVPTEQAKSAQPAAPVAAMPSPESRPGAAAVTDSRQKSGKR